MFFFLDKIAGLRIGWNERTFSEIDFYRLCKRFKIKVVEIPLRTNGFYYRVRGKDFIAVDSRLAGPRKLLVLFHELGHFLFHTPESGATANFHGVGRRTRQEREADLFALCAIIPRTLIEARSLEELIEDDEFSAELVEKRCAVFRRYGL